MGVMTIEELHELVKYIYKNYSPWSQRRINRVVKYVDPHIDMRTGHCFSITLRGFGWEKNFHCCNEHANNPKSLKDRVMEYLINGGGN